LVMGLQQVNDEIKKLGLLGSIPSDDQFIPVMKKFSLDANDSVGALKKMGQSLDSELRSLLAYYGETPNKIDALKPEDFFGLILTFSSSLQKAAVEVRDISPTIVLPSTVAAPKAINEPEPEPTVKGLLVPTMKSQGHAAGGRQTLSRGDLDQAIRSMRDGKRRTRPDRERPLSKIFLDGGRPTSRVFD